MKSSPAKLAYQKTYNEAHRDQIHAYHRAYRERNREERRAYSAAYLATHRDERHAYHAAHREDAREKDAMRRVWFIGNLNVLKQAQGCNDCGTSEGKLHHHHVDPRTKKYCVSHMYRCSLEALLNEIAKCTVLCRSCHWQRHAAMIRVSVLGHPLCASRETT